MNDPASIGDDELHAYIDGELDAGSRTAVEGWLAGHPEDAAKVDAWRAQGVGLHAIYDGVLDEPVPAIMSEHLTAAPGWRRSTWWMQAAAAVILFAAGIAAGWGLHGTLTGSEVVRIDFVRQAMGAHAVFSREKRHAVEVWADKEERHLVRWLSNRLGQAVQPPPLGQAGFRLVGGRLIAHNGGPAAQFMYEDTDKRRVTLYIRRTGKGTNTAFRFVSEDGIAAFYWKDQPLSYALIARMEREELLKLARIVHGALGP